MELHSILNSVGLGITIIGLIWVAAVKLTRLEVKVETLWKFLVERAVVEGVTRGLVTLNSPVRLEPHSLEMLKPLSAELVEFGKLNENLKEADLMLAIQGKFGAKLVKEVCIPNNITLGVCLLIATAIAKNVHTLTEILDEYHVPDRPWSTPKID